MFNDFNGSNKDESINLERRRTKKFEEEILTSNKEGNQKGTKKKKEVLDPTFNLEESYFYQIIPNKEWDEIKKFIGNVLSKESVNEEELKVFFDKHPKINKGNVEQLQKM